jgi:hypothetical protein
MWPDVIGAIWFLDTRREDESPAHRTHAAVAARQAGSDWFARLRVKLEGFRSVRSRAATTSTLRSALTASLPIAKDFIERDLAGEEYVDIFDDEFFI